MKFALINNGAITGFVQPDVAFSHLGKQYSARFLRSSTKAEKVQAGVYEVIEGARPDERFYWVSEPSYRVNEVAGEVEASYTGTAKLLDDREEVDADGNPMYVQVLGEVDGQPAMVDSAERLVTKGLKSQWIAQIKSQANSQLAATDWYVIRKAERGVAIPQEVQDARAQIVTDCNQKEAAIAACTTVEELMQVV